MPFRKTKFKFSIKVKILGILALILFLSYFGYLCIISYMNRQVAYITQDAVTQIYDFENKVNLDLKNNILTKFLIEDVKVYANYINREFENFVPSNEKESDALIMSATQSSKTLHTTKIFNLLKVIEIERHRPGYMFIINNHGRIVAVEEVENSQYKNYFKQNVNLLESKNKLIVKNIKKILDAKAINGVIKVDSKIGNFFVLYSKIKSIDCTLIKILPLNYLNNHVKTFTEKLFHFINTIRNNMISVYTNTNYIALCVFLIIIVIAFIIGSFLARTIALPLNRLKEATKYIGKGNLIKKIKINTGDEIEELADNFNLMTRDLKGYITRLSKSISRRQAIEEEIKLAANIQLSSLPIPAPNFQACNIDLNAYIKPTKIVSGDFYDYFLIDDNNLFFAIGDVSGKSIIYIF